jgi:hypothetical protein
VQGDELGAPPRDGGGDVTADVVEADADGVQVLADLGNLGGVEAVAAEV